MNGTEYADHVPMTVLLPDGVAEPVVLFEHSAALRFAVVERDFAKNLGPEFDEPGNYILLDPIGADGTWGTYVGKASPGGVKSRLASHLSHKESWSRAVIIQRDTTHGFNSAQVGWLEGRLYDLMASAEFAVLSNKQRPSDETLPIFERNMLEATILPIRRLLRLLGYDPASADDTDTTPAERMFKRPVGKTYHGITLTEIVASGLIEVGAQLESTSPSWPANATVCEDGINYKGVLYATPSAAGSAVMNRGGVNGWDLWAVVTPDGPIPLATLRERFLARRDGTQA